MANRLKRATYKGKDRYAHIANANGSFGNENNVKNGKSANYVCSKSIRKVRDVDVEFNPYKN